MALPGRRARPLGPVLTASLALHLSVLILLLLTIQRQPRMAEEEPPADFAMVFQGHSPERNSGPNPALDHPQRPGSPAPTATVPAVPPLPPSASVLPLPPSPPQPRVEARTVPPPPPPPQPQAPPEAKVPAAEPPPAPLAMVVPRLPPIPTTPSPSETPRAAPRQAERPIVPRPQRAAPSRQGRAEELRQGRAEELRQGRAEELRQGRAEESRPEHSPAFPTPLAFSFGLPGASETHSAAAHSMPPLSRAPAHVARPGQAGTIDLSFGPVEGGSQTPSSSEQIDGVAVSTDWLSLVSAWWERNSYYPPQAGLNNEEGDVTLHMRVDRDGRVEKLELIGRSGSQWLDMGGMSIFRDAHLPPLTPDMPQAQIPFQVTIHYMIIHHSRAER